MTPQQRFYKKHQAAENARSAKYNREHKTERTAYAKARRTKPGIKERMNLLRRLRKYGLSADALVNMQDSQHGLCAICRRPLTKAGDTKECIDHCHTTGKLRELLCQRCNLVLGKVKDSVMVLEAMIAYLVKHG